MSIRIRLILTETPCHGNQFNDRYRDLLKTTGGLVSYLFF